MPYVTIPYATTNLLLRLCTVYLPNYTIKVPLKRNGCANHYGWIMIP